MEVIDEQGYLFGYANVIDVFVALVLLTAVIGGGVVAFGAAPEPPQDELAVTVSASVPPPVADALADARPVDGSGVVAVGGVVVVGSVTVDNASEVTVSPERKIVRVHVVVDGEWRDGLAYFRNERLYVGRVIELDLGTTIIEGEVVSINGGETDG